MSIVEITIDAVDRTSSVMARGSYFEESMNAVPGKFELRVKDPDQSLSFVTGSEIACDIDGVRMFGGYVTNIGRTHFAPADYVDANAPETYTGRVWVLRGTNYNIAFDRRVVRNTADYLHYIKINETQDGPILTSIVEDYADMSEFSTAGIDTIATIPGTSNGYLAEQGKAVRFHFENLYLFSSAVYYIDGNKVIQYKPYDDVEKRWGFSDTPNFGTITTSPDEYQGATIGYRDPEATEDGSYIVNDALIWGGSQFAGASGGTVFKRQQDSTSQSTYGRWQHAETHFGEQWYQTQAGVDARAAAIVLGPPGADATGQQKGLRYPQWEFRFNWLADQVPLLSGLPDHIRAGDIVTIEANTFGVTKLLPVRTIRTSFPALEEGGGAVVRFDATFGLQLSDPFSLWRYVLQNESRVVLQTVSNVGSSSTATVYGASFRGAPTPTPDGVETVFSIPFGYISGTVQVWNSGLIQRPGIDFTESDNEAGEITMSPAPHTGHRLWVECSTLAG